MRMRANVDALIPPASAPRARSSSPSSPKASAGFGTRRHSRVSKQSSDRIETPGWRSAASSSAKRRSSSRLATSSTDGWRRCPSSVMGSRRLRDHASERRRSEHGLAPRLAVLARVARVYGGEHAPAVAVGLRPDDRDQIDVLALAKTVAIDEPLQTGFRGPRRELAGGGEAGGPTRPP